MKTVTSDSNLRVSLTRVSLLHPKQGPVLHIEKWESLQNVICGSER